MQSLGCALVAVTHAGAELRPRSPLGISSSSLPTSQRSEPSSHQLAALKFPGKPQWKKHQRWDYGSLPVWGGQEHTPRGLCWTAHATGQQQHLCFLTHSKRHSPSERRGIGFQKCAGRDRGNISVKLLRVLNKLDLSNIVVWLGFL